MRKKLSVRDFCYICIMTSVIAACAQIIIPMPHGVHITLQTFAIAVAGILLGAKKGAASALIYVMLGAVGAPVFALFNGGFNNIIGPTGGFILSFPIMAMIIGYGARKGGKLWLGLGLLTGVLFNYACGAIMYAGVMGTSIGQTIGVCVIPFIPGDIVKMFFAAVLGKHAKTALIKGGILT